MKQVAIVGIQGVPAKYGGFETLVENIIGDNSSPEVRYTVFCSSRNYATRMKVYKGAKLKYVPLFYANGIQSTLYDILSMLKCLRGYDTIVVLGVSGCIFLPIFRFLCRKRLIVNVDGLEHKRAKWGKLAKWFLRISEAMAVRYSDVLIADNKGIQDYVEETYHKPSELIAYGGDHVLCDISVSESDDILGNYCLTAGNYAIAICRIEPENNVHTILEAFCKTPDKRLVFIGNWQKSPYGKKLVERFSLYENITIIPAIYDLKILNVLRSHCGLYIHGHSAGGTNPSLVEAMFFGKPIIAFDCVYNRESTENKAIYFDSSETLIKLLTTQILDPIAIGQEMKEIANRRYRWEIIAQQYERLYDSD